jgi:hypothetical protein
MIMKIRAQVAVACAVIAVVGTATSAEAGVLEFVDKGDWFAAVGPVTTIDFTGFPEGTFITDQFEDLGVLFTDGDDNVGYGCSSAPNDCWGLDGNTEIRLAFLTPQAYIAADFPGGLQVDLFSQGQLIYSSSSFGGSGVGFFAGLVSSEPFDAAVLSDPFVGDVALDDLHFGVPGPAAIWLFGLAALCPARRRQF